MIWIKISENALLPNAPKLNQTEEIQKKNRKFKRIQTKVMNQTMENMTKEDELEFFLQILLIEIMKYLKKKNLIQSLSSIFILLSFLVFLQ